MSDSFDFKSVGLKVFSVLTDYPDTRDDDKLLLMTIWEKESNATEISELFKELIENKISHFESIRRMRQKIQEKHPSLRGKKWDIRHKMEGCVCDQLTFFDLW